jgi:aspartyl-tRNA(Asn)/glutamyl-tRNA(Gln) amidotransferase subunit A
MDEKQDDPVTMYLNDVFTVPANLAGCRESRCQPGWTRRGCRSACR